MKENKIQIHKLNSIEVKSLSFKYKTAKLFWPKTTRKAEKLRGPKQEKKRNWPRAGRHAIHLPPVGISGHWKMKFTAVFVFWKPLSKLFCVCLSLESWSTKKTFRSMENTFQSKENLTWFSGKCFSFILGGKHFLKFVKNLEMSYYLLIISNLVLKLLIAIYIYIYFVLNIYFSISSLRI